LIPHGKALSPLDYTLNLPDPPNLPNPKCPVSGVHSNQNPKYINLGNIFPFDEGEDFINNSKFRAVNDEYKILFE
jgi:hypothetical protein